MTSRECQSGRGTELPRLHDAEIIAVAVDRQCSYAQLDFRAEDGTVHSAQLHGLKAFRTEDLTLQNVVSRMLLSSRQEFTRTTLGQWLIWITSLSDGDTWLSEERKREWLDACAAGTLELVVIEPSAGAQIAALCDRLILV